MCAMRDPAQGTMAPPTSPDTTITTRSLSPIQPSTPSSSPQPWAIQVHRKLIRTRRLRNKCSEAKPECRITKLQIATTTERLIDIAQQTNTNNEIRVPLSDPDEGTTAPPTQQIATTTERLIGIAQRTNTNNEVERPSVYGIDAAVRDKGTRATFSHNLCALTESGD